MANSVWALTKPWKAVSRHPAACNNDSDSCHYQEEKLKLGCESAFSWKPNKTEEQGEETCELWVTLKVDNIERKDCGGSQSQQQVLIFIIRAHAYGSRPLLHHAQPINSV